MAEVRPLREVFDELAGGAASGAPSGDSATDPAELLAAHGHPGLPEDLVAEAVVNFADTAPAAIAEHLAPFVRAHSGVTDAGDATDAGDWFALLTTAPTADAEAAAGPGADADAGFAVDDTEVGPDDAAVGAGAGVEDPFHLDFGGGATEPAAETGPDRTEPAWDDADGPDGSDAVGATELEAGAGSGPEPTDPAPPADAAELAEPLDDAGDNDPGAGLDDLAG
jgi:hypothetical protein